MVENLQFCLFLRALHAPCLNVPGGTPQPDVADAGSSLFVLQAEQCSSHIRFALGLHGNHLFGNPGFVSGFMVLQIFQWVQRRRKINPPQLGRRLYLISSFWRFADQRKGG